MRPSKKRWIDAIKREHGCVDCGIKEGRLDFDHRDNEEKLFNVGCYEGRSWDEIAAEIAKCDVRCKHCHGRRHMMLRRGPIPEGMKRCSWCQEVKPLDEFHRERKRFDGRAYRCKTCDTARAKERYRLKQEAKAA